MRNINCKETMQQYILNQNNLYRLRWPIAILIAVIGINILVNSDCGVNRVWLYIVAFILAFITILVINIFVGTSFPNEELDNLVRKCQHSISDPRVDVKKMKAEDFANYTGLPNIVEGMANNDDPTEPFSNDDNENVDNDDVDNDDVDSEDNVDPPTTQLNLNNENVTEAFANPNYLIDDRQYHETKFPLGDSWPPKSMSYKPLPDNSSDGKCLLGRDGCVPLCSGYSKNPCNVVAPIPGPQWQVQNAATVQERLKNQQYVPSTCPVGPTVLSRAPDCKNLNDFNASREPRQVTCYPSVEPKEFPLPANQN